VAHHAQHSVNVILILDKVFVSEILNNRRREGHAATNAMYAGGAIIQMRLFSSMMSDLLQSIRRPVGRVLNEIRIHRNRLSSPGPKGSCILFELGNAVFSHGSRGGLNMHDSCNQQIAFFVSQDNASKRFQSGLEDGEPKGGQKGNDVRPILAFR